uniref:Uncharacterized protein n=1 Tax=Cacopsylla melanoneura TaxID=428564 RepID=A0A8D8RJ66_9HEMI
MGGGGPKRYRPDTGGIAPMNLEGRMAFERERLFGMTDAERVWLAQFVKYQHLSPHEPVEVPEIYQELYISPSQQRRVPIQYNGSSKPLPPKPAGNQYYKKNNPNNNV